MYFELGRFLFETFPLEISSLHPLVKYLLFSPFTNRPPPFPLLNARIAVDQHYFISFSLLVTALILFVLLLEKDFYKVQYMQLIWTIVSISFLVFLAQNWVRVIFQGLIWSASVDPPGSSCPLA